MSSVTQRLIDAEGAGDVKVHGPLHGLFRDKGAPNNLARSFSSIWALRQNNANDFELYQDSLQVVEELAMDFSENLILRNDRNLMSEEVRASVLLTLQIPCKVQKPCNAKGYQHISCIVYPNACFISF